jgi:hypothetical protein
LRKRTTAARSKGGGVKVDGLRKMTAATCSEAGVEVATCSGARDEASMCFGARIEDGRWRQRQQNEREHEDENLLSVTSERACGLKFLNQIKHQVDLSNHFYFHFVFLLRIV